LLKSGVRAKNLKFGWFVIISAAIIALCLPQNLQAAIAAELRVSLATQNVRTGQHFTVNINVNPNHAVAGVQFSLSFNASLVMVDSVTEGNLLKSGGAGTFFFPGQIDNTSGKLKNVAGAIISPGQTVSTSGTLAVINMTAKNTVGVCPLTLSDVVVGDISGQTISTSITNGQTNIVTDNLPPVLEVIGNKVIAASRNLQFTVSAVDSSGDSLAYSASNLPAGASFNASARTFSWTPTLSQVGSISKVRFQVTDGSLTDTEEITITVMPQETTFIPNLPMGSPPVLSFIGDRSITAGSLLEFTVSTTDPDNDIVTYSASNLPTGANFSASTHIFSWIPNSTQVGTYSNIHFQVDDGSLTDAEDITITVNPPDAAPPVIFDVMIGEITKTDVSIQWKTDEKSSSQVVYWQWSTPEMRSTPDIAEATDHVVRLTNLGANSKYYYKVLSMDRWGNMAESEEGSFTIGIPEPEMTESAVKPIKAVLPTTAVVRLPMSIGVFNIVPDYGEGIDIESAGILFQIENPSDAVTDSSLILKISCDGEPIDNLNLFRGTIPATGGKSDSIAYKPSAGWESGSYSFDLELYDSSSLVDTSSRSLNIDEKKSAVVSWNILALIFGATVLSSLATILVIYRRRSSLISSWTENRQSLAQA
jgi:hypothetical protein